MKWRTQLPAYSPLSMRAVLAGASGLMAGPGAARGTVTEWLGRKFGCDELLLTDSGTAALTLAIRRSLTALPGAPIALPAYSCYSLATAADGADARVLLYDLDPATLAPAAASLSRALTRGAGAVVIVHLFGMPVDPDPVRKAVRAAGGCLIEDAAQGTGARWWGRPLGCSGDLTVLSFGRGKGVTAGRGGALLAAEPRANAVAPSDAPAPARSGAKEVLQLAAQWLFGRPWLFAVPSSLPFLQLGETVYYPPTPVRGMSRVALRVLARTLLLEEAEAATRRAIAARLLASHGPGLVPVRPADGSEPGYLRLPFVAAPSARAAATTPEARRLGIMPGYPLALCDLPGFRERCANIRDDFPGARLLAERLVTIPVHSRLSSLERDKLSRWAALREEAEAISVA